MTSKKYKVFSQKLAQAFVEKKFLLPGLIIYTLFFIKSLFFLDPDFGFHIKMGELILLSGIPATDPFSYTMSGFPYIDHEWLIDVFMHIAFDNIGWGFLATIFSLIALLALIIPINRFKKFIFLPMLLAGFSLFLPMGIRPQILSWFLFSILITALLNERTYKKIRFFIPILFLVWVNLHGSFVIGLFIFLLFILIEVWNVRKINFIDIIIFLISAFISLINPYGLSLWREVFMTTFDASLRGNVDEWRPYIFSFYPALWFYVPLSFILFIKYRKNFGLYQKSVFILMLIAGLLSARNMAFWAIVALPVLVECLNLFNSEVKKIKFGEERFQKAYIFLIFLAIFVFFTPIIKNEKQFMLFNEGYFYPDKAIVYLRQNPSSGNVFSNYNWGGYLIWNYPEKKVFVDGRMPSWSWSGAEETESNNAFFDYNNLLDGKISFNDIAEKYKIDTVLWSVPEEMDESYISNLIKQQESRKIGKHGGIDKQLEKEGWEIVYIDETSVIFRRPRTEKLE